MKRRVTGLMRKEFIQFFRDRALVLLILYTFLEIAICGWSLTLEARDLPLGVFDSDRSAESRALVSAFARLDSYKLLEQLDSPAKIGSKMDEGTIQLALVIPAEFSRDLQAGKPADVQLIVDGSNSSIAGQAMAVAGGLMRDYNAQLTTTRLNRRGLNVRGLLPEVRNELRVWYMPQMKYVHFSMLTMLAIAVLTLGVLVPAAGVVREKEAGTFEQLMVTPIRGIELIAAKILPFMLLELVGLTIGIAMSLWLFDVPLRGSLGLFYGISLLMFLGSSGIGVLMGTIAKNMQQTLLLAFFILFPVAFLSGTMVPISNMPVFLQWLTLLSPLRYYVEAGLGIFLKGVGLEVLWPQALALAVLGLVLMTISTIRLRRSLS
ncbi:MAG TPA: ABC transporter permease [Anaerolineales bacterium]|nr:ABC transporter permease [Anaerolineales bacterium]